MSYLAAVHVSMNGTVGMGEFREPRGYAQTCQFKGINDFLNRFKKLMPDPSAEDGEENL